MHNVEKWPAECTLKFLQCSDCKILKSVWPFFIILHERVEENFLRGCQRNCSSIFFSLHSYSAVSEICGLDFNFEDCFYGSF